MSKAKNPYELVDRYLQAIRFWLPKSESQRQLTDELGEDLREQIAEKEAALGRALTDDDLKAILKKCGSPMVVASRLGPRRSLIGPELFPIYVFVLKAVLLWIIIPLFVIVLAPISMAKAGGEWPGALAETLGSLWSGLFVAAGVITLVFATLERTHAIESIASKWDPSTLPPLEKPRKPTRLNTACSLAFSLLGLIWILLLPQNPWLALGPAAAILQPSSTLHAFYLPIVVLSVLALLRNAIILARPQWVQFPLASLIAVEIPSFLLSAFALDVVGRPHGADWHPFFVLTEGARNIAQYAKVPTILNLSLLAGLLSCLFIFGIAAIVHTWQLLRLRRENRTQFQPTASLEAR